MADTHFRASNSPTMQMEMVSSSGRTVLANRLIAPFQFLYWISVFLVFPLAVAPSRSSVTLSPEQWVLMPKAFCLCVSSIVGVAAVFVTYPDLRLTELPKKVLKLPPMLIGVVGIALLTVLIEAVNSRDFLVTLIGSAARVDGSLIRFAWFLMAIFSYALMRRTRIPFAWITWTFVVGSLVVGLWAAFQTFGIEPLWLLGFRQIPTHNPIASFGHLALVSAYVGMGLATAVMLTAISSRYRYMSASACVLLASLLVLSDGRAGAIGFAVAFVVGFFYTWWRRMPMRGMIWATLCVVLGTGLGLSLDPSGARQVTIVTKVASGEDTSFGARSNVYWPVAAKAIMEKPLLGWGIDGFSGAFWSLTTPEQQFWVVRNHISKVKYPYVTVTGSPVQAVKRSRYAPTEFILFTVDRAHNYFLDMAVSFGLPFLGLFMVVLFIGIRYVFRSRSVPAFILSVGPIAYIVFGMAWFPLLQIEPVFWSLVGTAIALAKQSTTSPAST